MSQQVHQHIHAQHDAHLQRTVRAIEGVIDEHLFPNLSVLHKLIAEANDPEVSIALNLTLQRTRAAMRALGDLLDQVRPLTLDDPLGLPHVLAVIEEEVERSSWTGRRQFEIDGDRVALAPAAVQEVWRIAREVLDFVMYQTATEAMLICLKYPGAPGESMRFTVSWIDRYVAEPSMTRKLYIEECAQMIGGHVTWQFNPTLGCGMRLTFPASLALGLQ